jgi:putative ABC transport system permease protein
VIGVMEQKGQTLHGHDQDDMILVPITTARNRLLGGSHAKLNLVHYISVKGRDGADLARVEGEMRALLRERHRLHVDAPDDFTIRNLSEVLKAREESTRAMTLLLTAVALVSLIIGGVGIMNIMLVSVTERTREIGLRMAVGARARDILSQFVAEATALALAGGLFGVFAGIAVSYAIEYLTEWRIEVDSGSVVLALAFAASIGILSGLYPARKASRLVPVDALR